MTELGKLAEQARLSMHELAIGFVLEHSIIGSVMIDPRTCKQLNNQIQSAATRLTTDVLDRIDEIASPGVDINPDNGAGPSPPLTAPRLRHRSSTAIRRSVRWAHKGLDTAPQSSLTRTIGLRPTEHAPKHPRSWLT
jgi:hypothetical protein